ncbi:hypothetical protein GCM10019059_33040 [Camelimonas fluminis]|uniref:Helix-turn-helix transcriptional regulator n=1 Tax=Camelimonas fluminis TaxID=1576911 RepID=A0ABV7UGC1_9HYPH|nr:helix-turn-helix domain-containing protein [Camelimonas fluminis]GHE70677.1 hypothetical protein GCM10019059_33040 [Camelimonas fluminis]
MKEHTPTSSPGTPRAVRLPEAMHMTGLSRGSLYRAIADGRLQSIKIGKCRLFLLPDIERFLNAGRDT